MGIIDKGLSAIGRLAALGVLAAAFLFGLAGVVYMSLQGAEVKVPEITGLDLSDGERELASLGLKIKKRADRFSTEKPNTVIEQLPKPGETVKTGQLILVVTSKGAGEGDERPATLKNTDEEEEADKIGDLISDKPKKPKANSNTSRKKADTARDVGANTSSTSSNSASGSGESNSNKKDPGPDRSSDKPNKNTQTPVTRLPNPSTKQPGVDSRPKAPPRP